MGLARGGKCDTKTGISGPFGRRLTMERLEERYLLAAFDILVYTETSGAPPSSIAAGVAAIEAMGAANDFTVAVSNSSSVFTTANLVNYDAIVFLNTSGNVLNSTEEIAFQQYIQSGGGWVGVHSAANTETTWSWYGDLLGARFQSTSTIQQATVVVADQVHPSTTHLPDRWVHTEEWYNFQANPRGNVHVLATVDEATYTGGADGYDHPIAWFHDFDGGRAFYTGLGSTVASYSEQLLLDHLLGGIRYQRSPVRVAVHV
jgi:cytochrome c